MNIKPIKTEQDYRSTLVEIDGLMHAEAGTVEGDRLDVLVALVEACERKHYPMELPDAVPAIEYGMERGGLSVQDLATVIGRPNRVYEVLRGTRPLTLRMIAGLHEVFGIPAESLLKQKR
ncbi:helix-turn-helix domain-containing protein [Banduia mediterranea]|uniref:helix-turn-helix domain-containing protein n=1 Tax=Banduia mediterranea TaxID=3075609 RepID=UPI0032C216C0